MYLALTIFAILSKCAQSVTYDSNPGGGPKSSIEPTGGKEPQPESNKGKLGEQNTPQNPITIELIEELDKILKEKKTFLFGSLKNGFTALIGKNIVLSIEKLALLVDFVVKNAENFKRNPRSITAEQVYKAIYEEDVEDGEADTQNPKVQPATPENIAGGSKNPESVNPQINTPPVPGESEGKQDSQKKPQSPDANKKKEGDPESQESGEKAPGTTFTEGSGSSVKEGIESLKENEDPEDIKQ